jgi:ABC-2 type transport system permease protein
MAAKRIRDYLRFIGGYWQANWAAAMEYRASFLMQFFGMFLNDGIWVLFWSLYFTRFPVVKGWTLQDLILLWAVVTAAFGLAFGLMYNAARIPELVVQGQLDYYLALPKPVLLHLLVSQFRFLNLGDALFGPLLLLCFAKLTLAKLLLYVLVVLCATAVFLGFAVTVGSLVFFLGQAEGLAGNLLMVLVHFATYPTGIFSRAVKVLLFTLIPAGFVATLPVEIVREFNWSQLGLLAGGAAFFAILGATLFGLGLRRYESGSLMMMRQ